jgi:hypothetical protein
MTAPVKLSRSVEKQLEACTSTDLRRAAERASGDLKRIGRKPMAGKRRQKAFEQATTLAIQHAFYTLLAQRLTSMELGYKAGVLARDEEATITGTFIVATLGVKVIKQLSEEAAASVNREAQKFS